MTKIQEIQVAQTSFYHVQEYHHLHVCLGGGCKTDKNIWFQCQDLHSSLRRKCDGECITDKIITRIKPVCSQSAMILMNVYCNKILKPVDGSCCQPRPPLTLIQKLAACFFTLSIIGYLIFYVIHRNAHRKNKPCPDLESGEEKKNIINTPVSSLEILLQSFCKLGLIMAYFYMCDRANLFMKENKFYTHSSFFIPIIYILVLGVFYNENTKEVRSFSLVYPIP